VRLQLVYRNVYNRVWKRWIVTWESDAPLPWVLAEEKAASLVAYFIDFLLWNLEKMIKDLFWVIFNNDIGQIKSASLAHENCSWILWNPFKHALNNVWVYTRGFKLFCSFLERDRRNFFHTVQLFAKKNVRRNTSMWAIEKHYYEIFNSKNLESVVRTENSPVCANKHYMFSKLSQARFNLNIAPPSSSFPFWNFLDIPVCWNDISFELLNLFTQHGLLSWYVRTVSIISLDLTFLYLFFSCWN
jgi:hypothetical protein